MAVGILGVGLTMVASVFPVAVDQSRRSRESTMAAMCARSVVASMKARRDKVIPWCRRPDAAKDKTDELSRVSSTTTPPRIAGCLPGKFRVYNPNSFLYDDWDGVAANQIKHRWYSTTDNVSPTLKDPTSPTLDRYPTWLAGNYVPVVFASPISTTGLGPWRVTIVVYRAGGNYGKITGSATLYRNLPEWLDPKNIGTADNPQYLATWRKTGSQVTANRGSAGDYVIDNTIINVGGVNTCTRGEAYLVSRVVLPTVADPTGAGDQISLATGVTAVPPPTSPPLPFTSWVSMPKAVAVFHTVIGE
jgi:type II secretory pathway pseudopilin PulG